MKTKIVPGPLPTKPPKRKVGAPFFFGILLIIFGVLIILAAISSFFLLTNPPLDLSIFASLGFVLSAVFIALGLKLAYHDNSPSDPPSVIH